MGTPITREQLLTLRLASHFPVNDESRGGVVEAIDRMLAVQAQEFGQALWAVGSRVPGSIRDDVLGALASAQVVRSYPIRGTLHFVRPADLRWMLDLTSQRMLTSAARRLSELELDQHTLDRARDLAGETLEGGIALGRDEFLQRLHQAGISTAGQRGYHIIWYLAQTRTVCWGPPDGAQQALVLLDEWAPGEGSLNREEALRRFVLGYFGGHGPATLQDFVWWSKLTVADARIGLSHARGELVEYEYDGASYWASAALSPNAVLEKGLLLPGYDEYVLGYRDRSLTLPSEYASRIMLARNGVFKPSLVLGGRAVGTWRRDAREGTATLSPFPECDIGDPHAFDDAIQTYERFLAS